MLKNNVARYVVLTLLTLAGILLLVGSATQSPPMSQWGKTTPFQVSSNAPNAKLLTNNDNIVGDLPVHSQLQWNEDKHFSPFNEMIESQKSGKTVYLYFTGKIVAPGYKTKHFRKPIGHYVSHYYGFEDYLEEKININMYLEPIQNENNSGHNQNTQQQQQQQQIITIPTQANTDAATNTSCIKKLMRKGFDIDEAIEICD